MQRIGNDAATNDNLAVLIKCQAGHEKAQKTQKKWGLFHYGLCQIRKCEAGAGEKTSKTVSQKIY